LNKLKLFFSLLVLVAIVGCGGDSSTSPTPTPTTVSTPPPPPPPSPASITLEASDAVAFVGNMGNVFVFDLRITETGGGGAHINFIRLEVFRPSGEFKERQEIGAQVIISVTGSNRIEANSTRLLEQVAFIFRTAFKGGPLMVVTVGLTDDTGRDFEEVISFVFRG